MTDAEAATYPVAVTTAGMGLYNALGLPRPSAPSSEAVPVLVYGGNTAVGAAAIQLAKLYAQPSTQSTFSQSPQFFIPRSAR